MKKLLLSSAAALALGVSSVALAADLPTYEAPAPVVSAPVVTNTWSGFYAGLHAGWGWGDADIDLDDTDFGYYYIYDLGSSIDADGWLVGAQAGFNWQMGMLVLGLEVDASWTDIDGEEDDVEFTAYDPGYGYSDYTADFDVGINWLASVRARAGVAFDRILLYGTGGVAFAGVESDIEIYDDLGDSVFDSSDKSTEVGWVIGAGVEGMVTSNITARLEYLHYEFGDVEHSSDDLDVDYDLDVDVVRAGINWKF